MPLGVAANYSGIIGIVSHAPRSTCIFLGPNCPHRWGHVFPMECPYVFIVWGHVFGPAIIDCRDASVSRPAIFPQRGGVLLPLLRRQDFESWAPIWSEDTSRDAWHSAAYQNLSLSLVLQKQPRLSPPQATAQAKKAGWLKHARGMCVRVCVCVGAQTSTLTRSRATGARPHCCR